MISLTALWAPKRVRSCSHSCSVTSEANARKCISHSCNMEAHVTRVIRRSRFGGGGYRTGAPCSLPGYEPAWLFSRSYEPAWLSSLPPITNAPPRKTRRSPCLGRPETLQLGLEKCRCTKSRCCNICRREFTNEGCRREFTNEGGSAAWLEREKKETLSFVQLAPYLPGGEAPALACLDSLHSSGGSRLWMIARSRLAHAQCSQQNHFLKLLRAKFTYSGVENIL